MKRKSQEPQIPHGATWTSVIDFLDEQIAHVFNVAIARVASMDAWDVVTLKDGPVTEDTKKIEAPDISDPDHLAELLRRGNKPSWWPTIISRLAIFVHVHPDDGPPSRIGPYHVDVNNLEGAQKSFRNQILMACETIGFPFIGHLRVEVQRHSDRALCTAWSFEAAVGNARGKKSLGGEAGLLAEHLADQVKELRNVNLQMFMHASSVINASATAINALRGANMPPPWMQDGEKNDEMPLWAKLLMEAGRIAVTGGDARQAFGAALNHDVPVREKRQHQLPGHMQRRALPGPESGRRGEAQEPEVMDMDLAQEDTSSDYAGWQANEDDVLDDGFDSLGMGHAEDEEQVDDERDEQQESQEENDEEETGDEDDENPLLQIPPEDLGALLSEYVDRCPDKDAVKRIGIQLASKIL